MCDVECRHKPSDLYSRIKVASELTTASGGLGLVTQVVVASKTGKLSCALLQWCSSPPYTVIATLNDGHSTTGTGQGDI